MSGLHTTTGTALRPAHLVSGQGLTYRLSDEIEGLWRELPRTSGHRSTKTLAKSHNLRVALIALEAGAAMDPRAAESSDGRRDGAGPGTQQEMARA